MVVLLGLSKRLGKVEGSKTMAMRKSMIFIAAIATQFLIAEAGHAKQVQVKLTSDQVKTTCGTKLIYTSSDGYGCKVSCGDGKTCGFSCDKNGKNCSGAVVQKTNTGGGSKPGTDALLIQGLVEGGGTLGTQGPA